MRELGVILNCKFCDSFFVAIIGQYNPSDYRGGKGTEQFLETVLKMQVKLEEESVVEFRCPSCIENVHATTYQEWLGTTQECVLTVCTYTVFEEGEHTPVYENVSAPEAKPKWTIVQGVGPKTLELDKSRSGRIYKPTLRQYGEQFSGKPPGELSQEEYKYIVDTTMQAVKATCRTGERLKQSTILQTVMAAAPLFANWSSISDEVEAAMFEFDMQ